MSGVSGSVEGTVGGGYCSRLLPVSNQAIVFRRNRQVTKGFREVFLAEERREREEMCKGHFRKKCFQRSKIIADVRVFLL